MKMSFPPHIKKLLKVIGKSPSVLVGPVVWRIDKGEDLRWWYFGFAITKYRGFYSGLIQSREQDALETIRIELVAALSHLRKVTHLFNDELDMAKMAEAIWPSAKTTDLRRALERERAV